MTSPFFAFLFLSSVQSPPHHPTIFPPTSLHHPSVIPPSSSSSSGLRSDSSLIECTGFTGNYTWNPLSCSNRIEWYFYASSAAASERPQRTKAHLCRSAASSLLLLHCCFIYLRDKHIFIHDSSQSAAKINISVVLMKRMFPKRRVCFFLDPK